jgi:hypothetical protein
MELVPEVLALLRSATPAGRTPFLRPKKNISVQPSGLPDGAFSNQKIPTWVNFGRALVYYLKDWLGQITMKLIHFQSLFNLREEPIHVNFCWLMNDDVNCCTAENENKCVKKKILGGPCDWRCWYILWQFYPFLGYFGNFHGHLEYFVAIWYISPRFGMLYQEKSGNPG